MRPHHRPSGTLESEVLAALASSDGPMTPAEVQAELDRDLAYTTVMTTLARLHAKDAVTRERRGRGYAYLLASSAADVRAGLTARQMQKILDAGEDRHSVLAQFVNGLEDDDAAQLLRDLMERHPRSDSR